MHIDLQQAVDDLKASIVELKEAAPSMEARVLEAVDGKVGPISEEVTKVGDLLALQEKRVESLEAEIKKTLEAVVPGAEDHIEKTGGVNITKVVRGLRTFDRESDDFQFIREYNEKMDRDLSAQDDEFGGILVPMVSLPGIIELARARVTVWDPSLITVLSGLRGSPVEIPNEQTNTSIFWVGENEAPTKTDMTFGNVKLTPKKAAARVHISNRLLRLNAALAEQQVRSNIARGLGLEIDRVLLRGSGADSEPLGIANKAGILTTEAGDPNGGDFDFSVAIEQLHELEKVNTDFGKLGYVGHPSAFNKMRKERILQYTADPKGAYVMLPMSDANIRDRLGFDFRKTTTIPNNLTKGSGTNLTEVYFGNWEDLWLGLWADITFRASDVTGDASGSAMFKDQTWLFAFVEADVQLARAASFCLVNDAATT